MYEHFKKTIMETNGTLNNDYKQYEEQYRNNSKGMFRTFLTWKGRIRRLEYAIYFVVCAITASAARTIQRGAEYSGDDSQWRIWCFIEMLAYLILILEGIKRSHDTGSSGWCILIPFYGFVLLFEKSEEGINKYGSNPKRPYAEQIDELLKQKEEKGASMEKLNEEKTAISEKSSNIDTTVSDIFDYKQDSPSSNNEEISLHQFTTESTINNKENNIEIKTNNNKTKLYTTVIVILALIIGLLVYLLLSSGTGQKSAIIEDNSTNEVTQTTIEPSEEDSKPDPWEEELADFNAQMEEQARIENEETGKYVANGIKITNVQYDGTERVITYNYEVSNIVVARLPNYPKSEHKKEILNELKSDGGWQAAMKDYGLKVKYIFFNKKGKIVRSIELSSSDL